MHVIEQLIAERAQKLMRRPKIWCAIRPMLYKALGYDKAVIMADAISGLNGKDAFSHVSALLKTRPIITGQEHIPPRGAVMIIANHPTGLADGIFVFDALRTDRPDHIFMANADALRVVPYGEDIIIPVEWVVSKRTPAKARQTLVHLKAAITADKAVVIFPSGVLATLTRRGLVDKKWNTTAVAIARKNQVPIIPLRIQSRNSVLYYLLAVLNNELRDITLFHELLNKRGARPKMKFGVPIDTANLPKDASEATQIIRDIVEAL